jgi:hypothetical protein
MEKGIEKKERDKERMVEREGAAGKQVRDIRVCQKMELRFDIVIGVYSFSKCHLIMFTLLSVVNYSVINGSC